jgi:hypothetical protein
VWSYGQPQREFWFHEFVMRPTGFKIVIERGVSEFRIDIAINFLFVRLGPLFFRPEPFLLHFGMTRTFSFAFWNDDTECTTLNLERDILLEGGRETHIICVTQVTRPPSRRRSRTIKAIES